MKTWLITGGAGFIGLNLIGLLFKKFPDDLIINLDQLNKSSYLPGLNQIKKNRRHHFIKGNIGDAILVEKIFNEYKPDFVINLAAETHVDRSISNPRLFVESNVVGVLNILEKSKKYWNSLSRVKKNRFRFLQVSTDEVYGALDKTGPSFTEKTRYSPNNPYSATKAGADHLALSFYKTYNLPVLITHGSNSYGPFQFPEKLIPQSILKALMQKPIPVYGSGANIRDWLYVGDHCEGILSALQNGKVGEHYNLGGKTEKTNLEVVRKICRILDEVRPCKRKHESLISFVKDRPGHDFRYSMNILKTKKETGWVPLTNFDEGIRKTVEWYVSKY